MELSEQLLASCDDAEKLEGKSSDFSRSIAGVRAEAIQLKDVALADRQIAKFEDADIAECDSTSLKVCPGKKSRFMLSFNFTYVISLLIRLLIQQSNKGG